MKKLAERRRSPIDYWSTARMARIVLMYVPILLVSACSPTDTARVSGSIGSDDSMRGQVVDSTTSHPVDAFCVSVQSLNGNRESRDFRNSDGLFEWEGLPAGIYSILVTSEGYEPHLAQDVTITSGPASEEFRFPLQRGRSVQGHITDASTGEAIAEAHVQVPYEPQNTCQDAQLSTVTDDDGYFLLVGLARRPISIEVAARGYPSKNVAADQTVDEYMQIELSSGAAIYGRLTGRDGAPVELGFVRLVDTQTDGDPRRRITDEQGRFEFLGLPARGYRIDAVASDWPEVVSESLTLDQDTVIRDYEIRFDWVADTTQSSTVRGTMTSDSSKPPMSGGADTNMPDTSSVSGTVSGLMADEQAYVSIEDSTDFADVAADGSYEVRNVPVGDDTVVTAHTDQARSVSDTVDIVEGQEAVLDFALHGTGRLSGRITRAGEAPDVRVDVSLTHLELQRYSGAIVPPDGYYEIVGLAPGEYMVAINDRRPFNVQVSGDTWLDVDLCSLPLLGTTSLTASPPDCARFSISGNVVASEDGHGLDNASVTIAAVSEQSVAVITTDRLGAFSFGGLSMGSYLLTVHQAGYEIVTQPIMLQASIEGVTVMLDSSSGQSVTLWDRETGMPLRSVQIEVTGPSKAPARIVLSLEGDDHGIGALPTSLFGNDLTFSLWGYRPYLVSGWNGEPLNLPMSACQPFTEGCYPSPF